MKLAYTFAAEQLLARVPRKEIKKKLVEQGVAPEAAETVVEELWQVRSTALREAGNKNVLFGALWCLGGIVFTVLSYQLFTSLGSGSFLVASGAILVGGLQFFRGMSQLSEVEQGAK
jgi:hypothetical protein